MYPEQTVFRRIVHVQEHHQPAFAYIILSLTYLLTVSLIMFIISSSFVTSKVYHNHSDLILLRYFVHNLRNPR